ncbi:3-hydroxyacyl-CoA dehydrogenase [Pyrobaculum sp.]|uniref:3-hydroxyacyl-CoA dehydrogenase n=1 Tax=Pyrobaculum sp. TaxID=2004705 RepID=UPI003161BA5A
MIRRVFVVGAGTMGHGIAEVAALAGYEVYIYDISAEILNKAIEKIKWSLEKLYERRRISSVEEVLSRLRATLNFEEAARNSDIAIEAVPENIQLKRDIFAKLDALMHKDAILATNTSSLPISEIAEATRRPNKVVGIHFFNPPVLMQLVEIIKGNKTDDDTVRRSLEFVKSLGKTPILVNRDVPGFIVNRILGAIQNVACHLVYRGEYTPVEIDSAVRYKAGLPMGLFELRDFAGIDVGYMVAKALAERDPLFRQECPLIEEYYKKGWLGVKSGKGFYEYKSPSDRPNIPKEAGERVNVVRVLASGVNMAAWLLRNGIATKEDIDTGVRLGLGYPKGILQYADEWGIDEVVKELEYIYNKYGLILAKPDELLIQMLKEGKLGRKSREGFYKYAT